MAKELQYHFKTYSQCGNHTHVLRNITPSQVKTHCVWYPFCQRKDKWNEEAIFAYYVPELDKTVSLVT